MGLSMAGLRKMSARNLLRWQRKAETWSLPVPFEARWLDARSVRAFAGFLSSICNCRITLKELLFCGGSLAMVWIVGAGR